MSSSLSALDTAFFRFLNDGPYPPWLDTAARGLTAAGAVWWVFVFAAPLGWRLSRGPWRRFWTLLIPAAVLTRGLILLLKTIISRPRPFLALDHVRVVVPIESLGSWGFPSSHAANTAVVAALAWLCTGASPGAVLLTVLAALVSLSRVYIGVHYPLDIGAGALVAALVAWSLHAGCARWIDVLPPPGRRRAVAVAVIVLAIIWLASSGDHATRPDRMDSRPAAEAGARIGAR